MYLLNNSSFVIGGCACLHALTARAAHTIHANEDRRPLGPKQPRNRMLRTRRRRGRSDTYADQQGAHANFMRGGWRALRQCNDDSRQRQGHGIEIIKTIRAIAANFGPVTTHAVCIFGCCICISQTALCGASTLQTGIHQIHAAVPHLVCTTMWHPLRHARLDHGQNQCKGKQSSNNFVHDDCMTVSGYVSPASATFVT